MKQFVFNQALNLQLYSFMMNCDDKLTQPEFEEEL